MDPSRSVADGSRSFVIGGPGQRLGHDRRGPSDCVRSSAARASPAGLAAFEDAPCYREIVELEGEETPGAMGALRRAAA